MPSTLSRRLQPARRPHPDEVVVGEQDFSVGRPFLAGGKCGCTRNVSAQECVRLFSSESTQENVYSYPQPAPNGPACQIDAQQPGESEQSSRAEPCEKTPGKCKQKAADEPASYAIPPNRICSRRGNNAIEDNNLGRSSRGVRVVPFSHCRTPGNRECNRRPKARVDAAARQPCGHENEPKDEIASGNSHGAGLPPGKRPRSPRTLPSSFGGDDADAALPASSARTQRCGTEMMGNQPSDNGTAASLPTALAFPYRPGDKISDPLHLARPIHRTRRF